MANEKEVYDTAMAGYQAAYIEEEAAYRKAELTGDFSEQTRAFQAMGAHRAAMQGCYGIATEHVASMQRQPTAPSNKYGLSDEEVSIAHGLSKYASDLTDEKREQIYSENKSKLHRMRASGEYRRTTEQTG